MHDGPAFATDRNPSEAMQPGECAFHRPATGAKATAMWRALARQDRCDAARPQTVTVRRIVSAAPLQGPWSASRAAATPADRWQRVDHRVQGVMSLTLAALTGATSGTPRASVLMWCFEPFLRRSVGFGPVFPPRLGRPDPRSITVKRWSRLPPQAPFGEQGLLQALQTPARCLRTSRRQSVIADPQPISRGRIRQGLPDRSTKRIPVKIARSGRGDRPWRWPRRARRLGRCGLSVIDVGLRHARPYQAERLRTGGSSISFETRS